MAADAAYGPSTALIVVDVQNDFADPEGTLAVPGAERVIDAVNEEIEAASAAGSAVVYTQDWHPASTPHFNTDGGRWPPHCVRDTWGAQFHPALTVAGPSVRKGKGGEDGYSGFTMKDPTTGHDAPTGLDEVLRERGVDAVIVVGLALDYCVKATALDAVALGYRCSVHRAAAAPVDVEPGDGDRAVAELVAASVEVTESSPAP